MECRRCQRNTLHKLRRRILVSPDIMMIHFKKPDTSKYDELQKLMGEQAAKKEGKVAYIPEASANEFN